EIRWNIACWRSFRSAGGRLPGLEPCFKIFRYHGFCVQVALAFVARDALKKPCLRFRLNTFCDYTQTEAATHRHDGSNDSFGVGAVRQVMNERLVYFQPLNGKLPQIRQAGITGAEIIDRYFYAMGVQDMHFLYR